MSFEVYSKRNERIKLLEKLFHLNVNLLDAIQSKDSEVVADCYELILDLVDKIEQLPGPDVSMTDH